MSDHAQALFPNYTQLPAYLPLLAWRILRFIALGAALALAALLWLQPEVGLSLFWGLAVPVLPLVFFVVPGLWRNLCPLATSNQLPRLLGFTRGLTLTAAMKRHAYLIGLALLLILVTARKFLFNSDAPATALLILGALLAAFCGGLLFKGKSGWCSTFCPLLPVQRLYGQTPYLLVANTHCTPCVGCTKNCYDFNPQVAWLADQYDDDRHYVGLRRLFAGVLPGYILGFYMLPAWPHISAAQLLSQLALYMAASLALFQVLDHLLRARQNTLVAFYGAAAINIYYWFSGTAMVSALNALAIPAPQLLTWLIRALVLVASLYWIRRTLQLETRFLAQAAGSASNQAARVGAAAGDALAERGSRGGELHIHPLGRQVSVQPGVSVLEAVESCGLAIESGCRMGVCGADPIAVVAGAAHLSPIGNDERATLERLGHADNTRMACCARIQGKVGIELQPHRAQYKPGTPVLAHDKSIQHVVILGNGIAGVTAADHIRRRHPDCAIHLVGRERHPLYNRMGISRLIYGRSGMQGLYLQADSWYAERRIDSWLNTRAIALDTAERRVALATGESLEYDRLILALGSSCFVPPVEGFGMPGSFVLRDADDAMAIRDYAQQHRARHAVVAGAGLLGLEAAYALHKLGLHVTVLANTGWILNRQLDPAGGDILRRYLEGLGMQILVNAETAGLAAAASGRVSGVRLKDGQTLPCDAFLVCAGVRANTQLAREAGLEVKRGVVVDERMRTSMPGIYAAGDVAEWRGESWGLWPVAVEQGEIAAINALGGERSYGGFVPSTLLKVVGADVMSAGRFEPQSDSDILLVEEQPESFKYRKLLVSGQHLCGAILIGHALEAPLVAKAVKTGADVSSILDGLRGGDLAQLAKVVT